MSQTEQSPNEDFMSVQGLIQNGEFSAAQDQLDKILGESPRSRDALYMKAVCARYQNDLDGALDAIAELLQVAPDYGRAHQEEGHVHFARNDNQKALHAYRKACHFNPALDVSWRRQQELFSLMGNNAEAKKAADQLKWLRQLPREILATLNFIHEGQLHRAEQLCRSFLRKNPKHVDAMRLLADIGARLNILDDAEFLLESAIAFEPNNINARVEYMEILRKRQKYSQSLEQAERLAEENPGDPVLQSHLAIESMHNNDFERAFSLFDSVLEKMPGDPATLTSRGHALKTYGRQDDAVESYRQAYKSMPEYGDAWFGLANLKTYRFTDTEIEAMRREQASERLSFNARVQVCFALAKALEDREDYEEAFKYYDIGNELKRVQSRYIADQMTDELAAQATFGTPDLFEKNIGNGHQARDPIFIVGLPRAGSTLLEQILASHSQIDGTAELANILALAHRLRNRKTISDTSAYPEILHHLDAEQLYGFGKAFIDETRHYRGDAPFFIDKMPNNFRHIGLIHLILPNAKIIDARRNPMACCFSGFKQLFAEGQDFTYGLEQIGRYYHDYVQLMNHWDTVLPGKILRVQYEDVVDDIEPQVQRILDFLELDFEQSCVEFHKTKRVVRTASSEQVRQPINKKGLEAWRPFEPWLDPLKSALGETLNNYR